MTRTKVYTILLHSRLQTLQTGNTAQAEIGQMLYFMQHSGMPFTTLITGAPQNAFLTQFSPLWYVILPIYMLFGHSMLAVGTALYALMLSALVPLWRICRRQALSPWQTAALCAACALCPLVVGGGDPLRTVFATLLAHEGVKNLVIVDDETARIASNVGAMMVYREHIRQYHA